MHLSTECPDQGDYIAVLSFPETLRKKQGPTIWLFPVKIYPDLPEQLRYTVRNPPSFVI